MAKITEWNNCPILKDTGHNKRISLRCNFKMNRWLTCHIMVTVILIYPFLILLSTVIGLFVVILMY